VYKDIFQKYKFNIRSKLLKEEMAEVSSDFVKNVWLPDKPV